jgi:hypothetical protein
MGDGNERTIPDPAASSDIGEGKATARVAQPFRAPSPFAINLKKFRGAQIVFRLTRRRWSSLLTDIIVQTSIDAYHTCYWKPRIQ